MMTCTVFVRVSPLQNATYNKGGGAQDEDRNRPRLLSSSLAPEDPPALPAPPVPTAISFLSSGSAALPSATILFPPPVPPPAPAADGRLEVSASPIDVPVDSERDRCDPVVVVVTAPSSLFENLEGEGDADGEGDGDGDGRTVWDDRAETVRSRTSDLLEMRVCNASDARDGDGLMGRSGDGDGMGECEGEGSLKSRVRSGDDVVTVGGEEGVESAVMGSVAERGTACELERKCRMWALEGRMDGVEGSEMTGEEETRWWCGGWASSLDPAARSAATMTSPTLLASSPLPIVVAPLELVRGAPHPTSSRSSALIMTVLSSTTSSRFLSSRSELLMVLSNAASTVLEIVDNEDRFVRDDWSAAREVTSRSEERSSKRSSTESSSSSSSGSSLTG